VRNSVKIQIARRDFFQQPKQKLLRIRESAFVAVGQAWPQQAAVFFMIVCLLDVEGKVQGPVMKEGLGLGIEKDFGLDSPRRVANLMTTSIMYPSPSCLGRLKGTHNCG